MPFSKLNQTKLRYNILVSLGWLYSDVDLGQILK
jgi:hypothetical protein